MLGSRPVIATWRWLRTTRNSASTARVSAYTASGNHSAYRSRRPLAAAPCSAAAPPATAGGVALTVMIYLSGSRVSLDRQHVPAAAREGEDQRRVDAGSVRTAAVRQVDRRAGVGRPRLRAVDGGTGRASGAHRGDRAGVLQPDDHVLA